MGNRNSRLKTALESTDVSQTKLAEMLGISRSSVNERLKKDTEIDSVEFVHAVAKLTGYDFVWLLLGEGSPRQGNPNANNEKSPSTEVLEKLIETQAKTIRLLEATIDRLEEEKQQQSKTGA